jgi:hypothetical protein
MNGTLPLQNREINRYPHYRVQLGSAAISVTWWTKTRYLPAECAIGRLEATLWTRNAVARNWQSCAT